MKVIVSNFPIPDSFVDNVAHTLRAMGHEVVTPGKVIGHSSVAALRLLCELGQRAYPARWTPSERWAVSAAKLSGGANLLIWLTKSLRGEVLEEVRRLGVTHCVAWWGDASANMRGFGLLEPGWDRIYIKDEATVAKFQAVGFPAEHLHEACNPDWHNRQFKHISNDLVVAGSYYGYRQVLVGCLQKAGEPIALYGPPPPLWAKPAIKSAHRGSFIVKQEKSRIFGGGLACLNSTDLSEGNSLNCRAFEIAGACGLQLIEDKPAVADCFDPGSEVLTYRSVDEIRDHLAHARQEPSWATKIREAGHRRATTDHTYERRLRYILQSLELNSV